MAPRSIPALVLPLALLLAGCAQTPSTPGTTTEAEGSRVAHVGDVVGYFTITEIHADRVEGLDKDPYPVATSGPGSPRTLHVGDNVGEACEGHDYTLTAIDAAQQTATFRENLYETSNYGCPICLSGDTMVETPAGPVNVKDLRVGMTVWALKDGQRVALPVEKAGRAWAPHHHVVHLVLGDGRTLDVSPGHPLVGGGTVGGLMPGAALDGSTVESVALVAYPQPYTYDILAGDGYWANGILVGSTLAR